MKVQVVGNRRRIIHEIVETVRRIPEDGGAHEKHNTVVETALAELVLERIRAVAREGRRLTLVFSP